MEPQAPEHAPRRVVVGSRNSRRNASGLAGPGVAAFAARRCGVRNVLFVLVGASAMGCAREHIPWPADLGGVDPRISYQSGETGDAIDASFGLTICDDEPIDDACFHRVCRSGSSEPVELGAVLVDVGEPIRVIVLANGSSEYSAPRDWRLPAGTRVPVRRDHGDIPEFSGQIVVPPALEGFVGYRDGDAIRARWEPVTTTVNVHLRVEGGEGFAKCSFDGELGDVDLTAAAHRLSSDVSARFDASAWSMSHAVAMAGDRRIELDGEAWAGGNAIEP